MTPTSPSNSYNRLAGDSLHRSSQLWRDAVGAGFAFGVSQRMIETVAYGRITHTV